MAQLLIEACFSREDIAGFIRTRDPWKGLAQHAGKAVVVQDEVTDWGAGVAGLGAFRSKDYDPTICVLDFVFTVSNFRLCVVNLQPLEESFEVSCSRSSDGVSSLDFGPAYSGAFFARHSVETRLFFLPVTDAVARPDRGGTPFRFRKKITIPSNNAPRVLT
jgi:hypothetical protein